MGSKLRKIILKENEIYKFIPVTTNLGVAEFTCCPVYKRGKLKKFFMYPQQQNVDYYYEIEFHKYNPNSFQIKSWEHKGIQKPSIWLQFWCKKHKCNSFRLYVPRNSNYFTIDCLSTFSINFDYKKENDK